MFAVSTTDLRYHCLAAILLGQLLQSGRDVDSVADRGEQEAVAIADFAEDHVARMKPSEQTARQLVGAQRPSG